MYEASVNYWAVLVSALVFFGLGALWYGPLFGKSWMKAMGINPDDAAKMQAETNMVKSFGIMLVASFIASLATAHIIGYMLVVFPAPSALSVAWTSAFWLWLGYSFTYILTAPAFENRPWSYVFINGGYWLVGLLVIASILGIWR
ncbi:MAG: hypothetical protein AUJ47_06425 [Candidatus Marinimicrobia bacterium CG1_02_48_14]|nr:MAG: hypothetical protein AUJ47_06425 [Candidatus Marinimicrobia bacterium CG1_02_48_14]